MRASLILRPTFFALILILKVVVCMDDALDEADEIYRSVNEGFTSQDQEFLMDLFAEDDPDHNDDNKYHTNQHEFKDPQNRDDTQLTELDAEIDKLGMVFKLILRFTRFYR